MVKKHDEYNHKQVDLFERLPFNPAAAFAVVKQHFFCKIEKRGMKKLDVMV